MIIELMETLEEGINHIKKQLSQLRYEDALTLFADTMEGIKAIEEAIEQIKDELSENNIGKELRELLEVMKQVVASFKKRDELQVEAHIMVEVIDKFAKWREEVERALSDGRLN